MTTAEAAAENAAAKRLQFLADRGYSPRQIVLLGNLRGEYSLEGAVTALYEEFVHPDLAGETLDSTQEGSQDDFSSLPVETRNTDFDDVEDAVL